MILPGSEFTYADGRVLWTGNASGVDVERLGMDALRQPAVRHIAIANPAHAPYGRAAEAALRSLGLYDAVKDKLVMGENISQAFQMAQSGAAEVGIVALSLALAPTAAGQGHIGRSRATRIRASNRAARYEVDQESGSRAGLPRIPAGARGPRYSEAIWILVDVGPESNGRAGSIKWSGKPSG
jgi:ABC-type molybdate transport system substrate-binding protein